MTDLPAREDFGDYGQWPGRAVLDPTGRRLGEVREIYLDDATDRPEWVLVELEEGPRFVPLADARVDDEAIRVAQASDQVEAAPSLEVQTELTQDDERRLYSHYGLSFSEDASDSLLPELDDSPPADAPETLAATPPDDGDGDRPRPEAVDAPASEETPPRLRRYVGAPAEAPAPDPMPAAAAPDTDPPVVAADAGTPDADADADAGAPAPEAPPVLPAAGQTSEPEDTGPMVPPRPEPVAPLPPPPPAEERGTLAKVQRPAIVAGAAASIAAIVFILLRRRG